MEAVPRLPMLSFELKVSTEPTSFGEKFKHCISTMYHEDPESYNSEIQVLQALRAGAVRPPIDVTGCQLLKKYYCQLQFLKSRFAMEENQTCSVYYSWRDSLSNMSCSVPDVDFELMCILYNIGCLHTKLGSADTRVSPEGMKMACTHFQCAAWAFQTVKAEYLQMATCMLPSELIHYVQIVCLAQAQECILEKSMLDNRKATIIAKVAVQVVDYYKQALSTLHVGADEGAISDIVGSRIYKDWIKYLNFKVAYHKSIALLYQGQQAEEQQKMGERVAFYQAASEKLQEAFKLGKKLKLPDIEEALAFTGDVVEGKLKAAKNENEFIYHEDVPDKTALHEVKGASLVKGIPFAFNDPEVSGPDIFVRLVPIEAHEDASLYSEKKDQLLRQVGEKVESKNRSLTSFMSSLQIDVLTQMRQAKGLTQDLVDRAAAMSARPSATQDLVDAMAKLSNTYHDVEAMLSEIDFLLNEEEQKEQEYQKEMGARPPSIIAKDLTREAAKYREAHSKASESNQNLHRAMSTHIANLKILNQPLSQLQQHIPSIEFPNSEIDEDLMHQLEGLLGKVEEMKNQRAMLWTQLSEGVRSDDITNTLMTRDPNLLLEEVFQRELKKFSKQTSLLEKNMAAQENIFKVLIDTYAKLAPTRRYLQDTLNKRATTIAALVSSYDTYEDLLAKASKGLEFYTKLETNVTKLLQRIKSTCKVQDEEREQILTKNNKKKIVVPPTVPPSTGPKLKDYLDSMKMDSMQDKIYSVPYSPPVAVPASVMPIENQAWPPSIRPAPVGSEMNSDTPVCALPNIEQGRYSSTVPATNTSQGYYNPAVAYNAATSYSSYTPTEYGYSQSYQSDKNTDQTLADKMAALMSGKQVGYENQQQPQQYLQYSYESQAQNYPRASSAGSYTVASQPTYPTTVSFTYTNPTNSGQAAQVVQPEASPNQPLYYQQQYAYASAYNPAAGAVEPARVETSMPYASPGQYANPTTVPQPADNYAANNSYTYQTGNYVYDPATGQGYAGYSSDVQSMHPNTQYSSSSYPTQGNYTQTNAFPSQTPGQNTMYIDPVNQSQPTSYISEPVSQSSTVDLNAQMYAQNYYQQYYASSAEVGPQPVNTYTAQQVPNSSEYASEASASNYYGYYGAHGSGHTGTFGSTVSYSENATARPYASTSASPAPVEPTKETSNIDLLSGLDFTVNQAPLVPQQNTSQSSMKEATPTKSMEQLPSSSTKPTYVKPEEKINQANDVIHIERKRVDKGPKTDLLADPFVFKQFSQEVEKFEKFVDMLTTKTLNGPTTLDIKWKEIQDKQDMEGQKKSISVARCYPVKNRFPDILPYDYSRVKLLSTKDDYINASFIKDTTPHQQPFIVTQSPLSATFADFWTMIWEQQVEIIVCLIGDTEIGDEVYWPQEARQHLTLGNIALSLQNICVKEHWTERTISMHRLEQRDSKMVLHVQFTAWPGSLFPTTPLPMVNFLKEIFNYQEQYQVVFVSPTVVHCIAGVGRSGLFCVLVTAMMEVLENPVSLPDLQLIAIKMSSIRKNVLRDREHLKFAYLVFLQYLKELCVKKNSDKFSEALSLHENSPSKVVVAAAPVDDDPLNSLDPLWASKK